MKYYTLPIGLRFVLDDNKVYEVIKDKSSNCKDCAFSCTKCACTSLIPGLACWARVREDKCNVSFKHVGYFIPKILGSL